MFVKFARGFEKLGRRLKGAAVLLEGVHENLVCKKHRIIIVV